MTALKIEKLEYDLCYTTFVFEKLKKEHEELKIAYNLKIERYKDKEIIINDHKRVVERCNRLVEKSNRLIESNENLRLDKSNKIEENTKLRLELNNEKEKKIKKYRWNLFKKNKSI